MRKFAFAVTAIFLLFSLAARSVGTQPPAAERNLPAESGPQDTERTAPENRTKPENDAGASIGQPPRSGGS